MLISVVIPVYNVSENLFERALKSINAQDDEQVEIIVIDDGSEQNKSSYYQQICMKYYRCNYYRTENSGVSAARNYGVQKAQGEYILFVDSDDYITDQCIEQAEHAIDLYHPDAVFGYIYQDCDDEGLIRYKSSEDNPEMIFISQEKDRVEFLNHIFWYRSRKFEYKYGYVGDGPICRLFRKKLFSNNRFDEAAKWNEDTLWNMCLIKICHSIIVCKSLWYVYAERNGSAMQKFRENCYEEFLYITEKVCKTSYLLWNHQIDNGVYYRVWHDLLILSRTYIFNARNQKSFTIKYFILKKAIESKSYQEVIKKVNFNCERRKGVRLIKEVLNLSMKMHCYILTYILLKAWSKRS